MSRKIFVLLLLGFNTFAQNTNCVEKNKDCDEKKVNGCDVIIDFKNRNAITFPKNLKEGDLYRVKITNVNPNLYSISINSKDTVVSKALETPLFKDISLDAIKTLTSSFTTDSNFSEILKADSINLLSLKASYLLEYVNQPIEIMIGETPSRRNTIIRKTIDKYGDKAKTYAVTLDSIKTKYDALKMAFYTYRLNMMKRVHDTSSTYNFDVALRDFTDIRSALEKIKSNLGDTEKEYLKYIDSQNVKDFLNTDETYKTKVSGLTKAFTDMKTKITEFQEATSPDNIEKLLKTILLFENTNEFISLPLQFRKEQAKVTVKFTSKDETLKVNPENIVLYFPVDIREYWSIGTSFYYATGLKSNSFSTVATIVSQDVREYTVTEEEDINAEIGISATLRYGKKGEKSNLGWHGSFGPGVSLEKNPKPRLLFGGGVSLGNRHNIVLDAGIIAGYVDRKSDGLDLSITYGDKPTLTTTRLDIGIYFSLGYMYRL